MDKTRGPPRSKKRRQSDDGSTEVCPSDSASNGGKYYNVSSEEISEIVMKAMAAAGAGTNFNHINNAHKAAKFF